MENRNQPKSKPSDLAWGAALIAFVLSFATAVGLPLVFMDHLSFWKTSGVILLTWPLHLGAWFFLVAYLSGMYRGPQ